MAKFGPEETNVRGPQGTGGSQPLIAPVQPAPTHSQMAPVHRLQDINTLLGITEKVWDAGIRKRFTSELGELHEGVESFSAMREQMVSDALSATDQKAFDDIVTNMMTLERGEMSGVMSPVEARARKSAMLRRAVTDYPWMAPELKSIAGAFSLSSGTGASGGEMTPEEKGIAAIRQEAARIGVSPGFLRGVEAEMTMNEATISRKNAAQARGEMSFDSLRTSWGASLDMVRADMMGDLFAMVESDPLSIDTTDWSSWLSNIEAELKGAMLKEIATASQSGALISQAQRQMMEKDLEDMMAIPRNFVNSKDKLTTLKRDREIIEEAGYKTMAEMNPYYAFLVKNGMADKAAEFSFRIWPKFVRQAMQDDGIHRIQLLAEQGNDLEAMIFLDAWRFNRGVATSGLHNKLMSGQRGSNAIEETMLNGLAGTILQLRGDEAVLNEQQRMAIDKLTDGDTDVRELSWFAKGEAVRQVSKNPVSVKKLSRRIDMGITNIVMENRERPLTSHMELWRGSDVRQKRWVYDTLKDRFDIWDDADGEWVVGPDGDRPPESKLSSAHQSHAVHHHVQKMNLMYDLKRRYGLWEDSRSSWITQILELLNRDPNEQPVVE